MILEIATEDWELGDGGDLSLLPAKLRGYLLTPQAPSIRLGER